MSLRQRPSPTISTPALIRAGRAQWTRVRKGEKVRWPKPVTMGGPTIDLLARVPARQPEVGLLEVRNAHVVGIHGWIIVDGQVLRDQSWFGATFEAEVGDQWPPDLETVHLPGVTFSLLSEWANINYYHLMYDSIPRLDILGRAGYASERVDTFLCPAPLRDIQHWTELGLDPSRIVFADPKVTYETDTLLAPSLPSARFAVSKWAVTFLRERLSLPPDGEHRRLYLPRNTTRRITNEVEVWSILQRNGFERLDPGTDWRDARATFAAADVVVGAHGAGFTDLVFCPPNAVIFELIPTDHVQPYYFAAAASSGLRHRYQVANSVALRPPGSFGASVYDFEVDTDLFASAIESLVAQAVHFC